MYNVDTESIGFYGPTLLIQYQHPESNDIVLHDIFKHKVCDTTFLIEDICDVGIRGFNLVHDWFHLSKTYNVLKCLPSNIAPDPLDYKDVENTPEAHDRYCLKPRRALDLLLVGKRSKFQSVMKQKDIIIRKVPKVCSEQLVNELLDNIQIPDIYFAKSTLGYKWDIIPLVKGNTRDELTPERIKLGDKPDETFVNIRLRFNPGGSLKDIMKSLGHEITKLVDIDKMDGLPSVKQLDYGWWPCNGKWIDVYRQYAYAWEHNSIRREYARNDVRWLRILNDILGNPSGNDTDSILACAVGAMFWKGFTIDRDTTIARYRKLKAIVNGCPVNTSSPTQVKQYLGQVASPLEKVLLKDTRSKTLRKISEEWATANKPLADRCKQVIDTRQARNESQLLGRILVAGRAYFMNKVIGTKSNRMSGGGEKYIKANGSLNSQGIRKGDGTRSCFTLAGVTYTSCNIADDPPILMILCGGDFDGFEVSIAEAVYCDPGLRSDLLSGKKVHGLFGAAMYNKTYEEIMSTSHINKEDDLGLYSRAKTGFFGTLYGAQENKLAAELRISVEEARAGLRRFFERYPGVKKAQQRVTEKLTCLTQGETNGKITWRTPQNYVESILGFRRHFDLEFSIIHSLFNMASNISNELRNISDNNASVMRKDRSQTVVGATTSALYATAFSLSASVIRAGINHEIQSPGGEITKELQALIWSVQPYGINVWYVMPMNVHDELECPCHPDKVEIVKQIVDNRVQELRSTIPLIGMEWKTHMKSWGEK